MTPTQPRILVVSPAFFGYEQSICSELRKLGYHVDYFDERPSNGTLARAALRVKPSLMTARLQRHYEHMFAQVAQNIYETVLVIKAEVVPETFLRRLRDSNPGARFIFYSFDSIENSSHCVTLFPYFDHRYSFDFEDVNKFPELEYKPLFYTEEFRPLSAIERKQHDLSFVGTLHSDRYNYVKALFRGFQSSFGFFYVQARWYFLYGKHISKEFRQVEFGDVSVDKMPRAQVARVFRESRAVFDLQRSGQSGLTMRTFEVLASGAILVTTNAYVEREEFFHGAPIVVLHDSDPESAIPLIRDAIEHHGELAAMPLGFESHSLREWLRTMLAPNKTEQPRQLPADSEDTQ